ARENALGSVVAEFVTDRVEHCERDDVVALREEMLAGERELIERRRTSGASALAARARFRVYQTLALKLQQMLTHALPRQLPLLRELGNRGGAVTLQVFENPATAVGMLVHWRPTTAKVPEKVRSFYLGLAKPANYIAAALVRGAVPYRCVAHPTIAPTM